MGVSDLLSLSNTSTVTIVLSALAAYTIYAAIYRLYLSPIASFPGSRLAALTLWYEYYYDVYPKSGQYTFKIIEMHEKYGPIIRINPWELHIATPEFYDTLYSSTRKVDKWDYSARIFGLPGGGFSTVNHNLHRMRRAAIAPYFSTANVRRLQPVLEERTQALVKRLKGLRGTGQVVRCVVVASAFGADVIMNYCFGKSFNRLEAPDFDEAGYDRTHVFATGGWFIKHNYWILWIIKSLPESVTIQLGGALSVFTKLIQMYRKQVIEIMQRMKENGEEEHKDVAHRTIFHELLSSDELPPEEKAVQRLADEAQTIIGAAGETISFTMTVLTYHILANPSILRKLKQELQAAIPDPDISTDQAAVERLPYLTAVIKEGVRLGYGSSARLPRVPLEPLVFKSGGKEWVIPAGTPVGMTSVLIHHDESIFPDSHTFNPDRWINNPRLDRYLVSFSKGSRSCVGMNLAYAEIYLWISNIFRRFGSKEVRFESDEGVLELVDTTIKDVTLAADLFVPEIAPECKGVRFRVLA